MNDTIDFSGIALILTAFTGLVASLFAGYVAVKQLPQVHKLVNRNFTEQKEEIARLHNEINELKNTALTKSEAREAPLLPPKDDNNV